MIKKKKMNFMKINNPLYNALVGTKPTISRRIIDETQDSARRTGLNISDLIKTHRVPDPI